MRNEGAKPATVHVQRSFMSVTVALAICVLEMDNPGNLSAASLLSPYPEYLIPTCFNLRLGGWVPFTGHT